MTSGTRRSPLERSKTDRASRDDSTRSPREAAAFEALPFEVAVVDEDGLIVAGNGRWRAFARDNGPADPEAWIGKSYLEATARGMNEGAPGATEALALLEDALEDRPHHREVVYPCAPPGQERWFSMRASGYRASDGRRYAVVTHEEITDRIRAQTEAREHASELSVVARGLRRRNHDLQSFGHMVSHDLRAPLRTLDVLCDVVEESLPEGPPPATGRALTGIRREVARISTLVEGLLALSRVSERDLERTRVDLSAIARELVAELRRDHPQRKVDVRVADGLVVDADPVLARLLLSNLLSNAWKYTSTREEARIEVGREDTSGQERAFFVRDNGIGFARVSSAGLFEPFRRAPEAVGFEGSGIGLATVARIVERHGGRVWAEGEPNVGATFWFTLGGARREAG